MKKGGHQGIIVGDETTLREETPMAALTQSHLFSWNALEARSDLIGSSWCSIISPTSAWCNTLR